MIDYFWWGVKLFVFIKLLARLDIILECVLHFFLIDKQYICYYTWKNQFNSWYYYVSSISYSQDSLIQYNIIWNLYSFSRYYENRRSYIRWNYMFRIYILLNQFLSWKMQFLLKILISLLTIIWSHKTIFISKLTNKSQSWQKKFRYENIYFICEHFYFIYDKKKSFVTNFIYFPTKHISFLTIKSWKGIFSLFAVISHW